MTPSRMYAVTAAISVSESENFGIVDANPFSYLGGVLNGPPM